MNEDDIRYLFDSQEKYAVSHDFIVKYIATPKKLSVKKMIEQNELIAVKDYIVTISDEYTFTLNAFKYCIINYKLKCVKLFLTVEEDVYNKRIKEYQDTIEVLKKQNNIVDKKDVSSCTSTEVNTNIKTEVNQVNEELLRKVNSIMAIMYNVSSQLELLPNMKEQVSKISELENITLRLDKFLNLDLLTNSKKINSINIL